MRGNEKFLSKCDIFPEEIIWSKSLWSFASNRCWFRTVVLKQTKTRHKVFLYLKKILSFNVSSLGIHVSVLLCGQFCPFTVGYFDLVFCNVRDSRCKQTSDDTSASIWHTHLLLRFANAQTQGDRPAGAMHLFLIRKKIRPQRTRTSLWAISTVSVRDITISMRSSSRKTTAA